VEALLFRKYFGASLEEHRKRARLSRGAVSQILNVDEATVWRWEKGQFWPKDADVVVAVYTRESNGSPLDLWNEAVKTANADDPKGKLEQFLVTDFPRPEQLDRIDAQQVARKAEEADSAREKPQGD
jgi:predicted transcriptional regulator